MRRLGPPQQNPPHRTTLLVDKVSSRETTQQHKYTARLSCSLFFLLSLRRSYLIFLKDPTFCVALLLLLPLSDEKLQAAIYLDTYDARLPRSAPIDLITHL